MDIAHDFVWGRALKASQFQVRIGRGPCLSVKDQFAVSTCGVGPALRTGKALGQRLAWGKAVAILRRAAAAEEAARDHDQISSVSFSRSSRARSAGSTMPTKNLQDGALAFGRAGAAMAASMRLVWVCGQRLEELAALVGGVEQALAAVGVAGPLLDVAVVDELAQHAGEALLGDLEDIEQVGDRHAGLEVDEVEHAVMRAAEALASRAVHRRRRRSRDRQRRTAP